MNKRITRTLVDDDTTTTEVTS